jgi:hypothetical protein
MKKFWRTERVIIRLTPRASARYDFASHSDPERDANFFRARLPNRRKLNSNIALLNKRERVSLETLLEQFEERVGRGASPGTAEKRYILVNAKRRGNQPSAFGVFAYFLGIIRVCSSRPNSLVWERASGVRS